MLRGYGLHLRSFWPEPYPLSETEESNNKWGPIANVYLTHLLLLVLRFLFSLGDSIGPATSYLTNNTFVELRALVEVGEPLQFVA